MTTPKLFGFSLTWVPYAAGPVWLVLTVIMVTGAFTIRNTHPNHSLWIYGFVGICWLHPLYTWLFGRMGYRYAAELGGSLITLVLALILLTAIVQTNLRPLIFLTPTVIWLVLASIYLLIRGPI